ncbi:MAG TPA: CinA family protein [Cellvibrio sp.]|nr:CinA family protein [Cellvibrio sp.]
MNANVRNTATDADKTIKDIVEFLKSQKVTLTIAESCTAGEVCSLIANVSGCGSILYSGYVVYDERAKQECLGVQAKTIQQFGLTSEEVAREMASGALSRHTPGEGRPNFALAITGTAESDDEENGVVCFAYAARNNSDVSLISETKKFEGSRNEVRSKAARHAIIHIPEFYRQLTTR